MATESQNEALKALKNDFQVDKVVWPESADAPTYVYGRLSPAADKEPDELVQGFLEKYGGIYGIAARDEYRVMSVKQDTRGNCHVRVERIYSGRRVYPSEAGILGWSIRGPAAREGKVAETPADPRQKGESQRRGGGWSRQLLS